MDVAILLATSVVSFVFALTVLDQYLERRRAYQLVWSIGLILYFIASLIQGVWFLGVDGEPIFRLWYLTGAMLVAAYLGMGSVYLHVSKRVAHGVMAVLLVATVTAAVLALGTQLRGEVALLEGEALTSVVPGTDNVRYYPAYVGILTALLNSVGALALMGFAAYSAVVFFRQGAPGYRVVSNVLIAMGAIIAVAGGTLERFNVPEPHAVSLLLGVVIIYVGFLRSREVFTAYRIPFRHRAKQAGH